MADTTNECDVGKRTGLTTQSFAPRLSATLQDV